MTSNPVIYPVSAQFESNMRGALGDDMLETIVTVQSDTIVAVFQVMCETIGEYEHGSADVEDVAPYWFNLIKVTDDGAPVAIYANVCQDILHALIAKLGGE